MDVLKAFRIKFVACQSIYFKHWKCNATFDSWEEADKFSRENHTTGDTTLLKINNIWPVFMKEYILSHRLHPHVVLEDNDQEL